MDRSEAVIEQETESEDEIAYEAQPELEDRPLMAEPNYLPEEKENYLNSGNLINAPALEIDSHKIKRAEISQFLN